MDKNPLQNEIEAILPVLFAVKGPAQAVHAANEAAEHLFDLIDASARGELLS